MLALSVCSPASYGQVHLASPVQDSVKKLLEGLALQPRKVDPISSVKTVQVNVTREHIAGRQQVSVSLRSQNAHVTFLLHGPGAGAVAASLRDVADSDDECDREFSVRGALVVGKLS